jgi:hypothetical protein
LALCGLGLSTKAAEMMVEDEEDDSVFHHGFSMADEMDEEESGMMEDDELESERMADPVQIRIRLRRPPPFGLGGSPSVGGFSGYAGLGGFAGLGGLGLSGGFGMGFDDNAEDAEDSMRSTLDPAMDDDNTDDEERMADPLRVRVRVQRPGFPSFDSQVEMKDTMDKIMADPQLRFLLRARFGRRPFGFGWRWPFGFPFGLRRFGSGFYGRRNPFFFDNQHSDDDPETQSTYMDDDGERAADPLIEDIDIKERIRIRVPDRYVRFPRPFIRSPKITSDETDKISIKPDKLSPIAGIELFKLLLARERANSALLRQRFGLLNPDSFWCRRSSSVDCRGSRHPCMMP